MPLRTLAAAAFCLAGVLASGLVGVGQTAAGALTGRILAADTGAPVPGALVTATRMGSGPRTRLSATTDGEGRFELAPLPAGSYMIGVGKIDSGGITLGNRFRGERPTLIDVAAGRTVHIGDVSLPRRGVLSGRVLDEFAEPVVNARVEAGRSDPLTGAFVSRGISALTDDLGQYRLILPAGSYYVRAEPGPFVAAMSGQQALVVNYPMYPPTYYPGRAAVSEAATLEAPAGEEVSSLDIPLARTRFFSVAGVAIDAKGRPAVQASVLIADLRPGSAHELRNAGTVQADGRFKHGGLEAGSYSMSIVRKTDGATDIGSTEVTIGDADVNDMVVTLGPSGSVKGRVELDPPVPDFRVMGALVLGRPSRRGIPSLRPAETTLNDDLTFELSGLLGATTVGLKSEPAGWRVRTVMLGDRDITGQDLPIGPGETVSDVRVILTSRLAELSGTVVNARGEPAAKAIVLVFSSDHRVWQTSGFDPARVPHWRGDGAFQVKDLLPGAYYIVAIAGSDPTIARDPAVLDRLWPLATRMTISSGTPNHVALKLVTLP